jgi:thiamine pyrophosphokinase
MLALSLRAKPLLHVGDGDSFSAAQLKKLRPSSIIKLNKKKNYSDLEFCLRNLDSFKSKLIIGAHVDDQFQPDHGFLNLMLLSQIQNAVMADEKNWIVSLIPNRELSFYPSKPSRFSLAVFGGGKVSISGAVFNLKGKSLENMTQGLSNVTKNTRVRIKTQNVALIFVSSDITKTRIDA